VILEARSTKSDEVVVLRPYHAKTDREAIMAILRDPVVMERALIDRALTQREAAKFIRKHFTTADAAQPGLETMCFKATGEVIGLAGYRPCPYLHNHETDLEFGFVIAQRFSGKGYASAIGEKLILYALDQLNPIRILAACHPENGGSEKVLLYKLRMRFVADRSVEVEPGRRVPRHVYVAERGWLPRAS
jgi:[ribosomal protein S5]-alanine N-acetyltransferase